MSPECPQLQVQTLTTILQKRKKKTMVNEALLTRTVRYQQANDHSGRGRAASLQLGLQ